MLTQSAHIDVFCVKVGDKMDIKGSYSEKTNSRKSDKQKMHQHLNKIGHFTP